MEVDPEDMPDLSDSDPEPLEIEDIRQLAEEWQAIHKAYRHPDEDDVEFSFQRNVYETEDNQDILVICQCCGEAEMVAFAEPSPDPEDEGMIIWYPMYREEPN